METIQPGKPARLGSLGTTAAPARASGSEPSTTPRPVRDLLAVSLEGKAAHQERHLDVTDEASLARLRNGSPDDRQLARTIEQARSSYRTLLDAGARIVVGRSAGNGHMPAVTIIPKALLDHPDQAFEAVVHYGGMYGTAARPDPNGGLPARIRDRMAQLPPAVIVLCEARNHGSFPTREPYSPDWSLASDPEQVAADALRHQGLSGDRTLTVSAHSAGGRAIARIITEGRLACDRLELQDCLYANGNKISSGKAVLAWAGSPEGQRCREIVYIHAAHGQNSEHHLLRAGQILAGGQAVTRVELVRHYDAAFWAAPAAAGRLR
ncbi:MAG: hypothetical protein VKP57_05380 [Candidatus Sericytochromatia bacterium]|nr:hypothetical protein [Candidatus Sericytochromatia bacterium]